jgi:crossover junction endodeoxyribonuclease RuvC
MRILGIDPGLQRTGYGVVDHLPPCVKFVEGGFIATDASASLEVRLATIASAIRAILKEFHPDVIVVETLYAKYSHPQTAILMGHARGVILLEGAEQGLEVAAYPASLVKRSLTGHGRASKEQVAAMVTQTLGLAAPPTPNDVTDALALCLCHTAPMRRDAPRGRGARSGKLPPAVAEAIANQGGTRP